MSESATTTSSASAAPAAPASSCCTTDGSCHTGAAERQTLATVFHVSGMTCGNCEITLTRALSAVEGVTDVQVEVASGEVTVTTAGEPNDPLIAKAVDDAGYTLTGRVAGRA